MCAGFCSLLVTISTTPYLLNSILPFCLQCLINLAISIFTEEYLLIYLVVLIAVRTQGAKCQKCGGSHRVENHRLLAWCYKANPKSNPLREATAAGALCSHTFKCLNCKGDHSADDNKCPFWRHRFDKQWH